MPAATDSSTENREFVITRELNAPRQLVYNAWADPKQLAKSWGPKHFTNPVCEIDLRPGGAYAITMQAPDGTQYPMKGVYIEVREPALISYTVDLSGQPEEWLDAVFPSRDRSGKLELNVITTAIFEDVGDKTLLTVKMTFDSTEIRDAFTKVGNREGWNGSFDKLEALLAQE